MEDLDGIAVELHAALDGLLEPACRGNMGSDQHPTPRSSHFNAIWRTLARAGGHE
jgi:hypothetical protein